MHELFDGISALQIQARADSCDETLFIHVHCYMQLGSKLGLVIVVRGGGVGVAEKHREAVLSAPL
jgi:hypothetical protein